MARDTHDDGFHEIQLNGKQLVFLFMAATVVSVVIFLCGVLVGRGVGSRSATSVEAAGVADLAPDRSPLGASEAPAQAAATSQPAAAELDYFDRLKSATPADEELKAPQPVASADDPPPAPQVAGTPAPAPKEPSSAPPPTNPSADATSNAGPTSAPAPDPVAPAPAEGEWAVQIAALNDSGDAEQMARMWGAKGYDAYVVAPSPGAPAVYRVRIGTFRTRREADALAAKLQKEERIRPWVTR